MAGGKGKLEATDGVKQPRSPSPTLIALGIAAFLLLAILIVTAAWWLPPRLVDTNNVDLSHLSSTDRANFELNRLKAINDVRSSLLGGVGMLVTAVGAVAVFFGGRVAYLNYREAQRQNREATTLNREALEVARRGQVTERFGKAIDQLGERGEQESEKLDVRLGGIYALEQIARDSPELHWPIVEILTAFIREHTKARVEADWRMPPDIQASLNVLGQRNAERDRDTIDLSDADLRTAKLPKAKLQRAFLYKTDFRVARLSQANLQGAYLKRANLQDAYLNGANLQDAFLDEVNLQDAVLGDELGRANLKGVDLSKTAGLTQDQVDLAICDGETKLPPGLVANAMPVADRVIDEGEANESK